MRCYAIKYGSRGYGHNGISSLGLMCDARDLEWQWYICLIPHPHNETHAPKTTVVDTASIKATSGQGCPRCGGAVFAAEQMLSKGREWHRKCYKCKDCNKTLDSINACDGPDKDIYCKTCYGKKWGPHGYGFASGSGFLQTDGMSEDDLNANRPFIINSTTTIKAPEGQGCPRCGGAVFAAEQQLAKGTMWHKKCFNCSECHRPLDSMLACDGPDKEIHCRSCYGRRSAIGGVRPTDGSGCPRCGFIVYEAEKMISKSSSWHKRCFNCSECHRSLDSTNFRGCYGRQFGPRGVGFGLGAGVLSTV
ncbi:CLUMA_CG020903, isoform C [Clunio marinus]|uniref:CLUMA_CG020903, isoform C n=1 Tax=Clunio marinus TaxID=568069 RepID=A0A1J1J8S5_9DIPT|nr:CLUMA_CG020903, isoform C [Clunio marinus]